jgi:hypothetical protein
MSMSPATTHSRGSRDHDIQHSGQAGHPNRLGLYRGASQTWRGLASNSLGLGKRQSINVRGPVEPAPRGLGQQRLIEPVHSRRPAAGGQLHQRGRMRHRPIQRDPTKPSPGNRMRHLPTQSLITQPVPKLQSGGPGDSHPRAPTERSVTVSRHSALLIAIRRTCAPIASARTARDHV